jgi:hypothetical protein
MLSRLVLNWWAQVILFPLAPKWLGLDYRHTPLGQLSQLIFDKGIKKIHYRKDSLFNKC